MSPKRAATPLLCLLALILLPLLSPARALGQEETKDEKIRRLSGDLLRSGDEQRQRDAVFALAEMGEDALPPLIESLETNRNTGILNDLVWAFDKVGVGAAPALVKVLRAETAGAGDDKVLRYAANALKLVAAKHRGSSPAFREAVPYLMEVLKDKRELEASGAPNEELEDYDAAADCLQYIGRDAREAVPLLIELIKNEKQRDKHYRKREAVTSIVEDLTAHSDFSANEQIIGAYEKHRQDMLVQDRNSLDGKIAALRVAKELDDFRRAESAGGMFGGYAALARAAAAASLVSLGWLAVFLLRPIWLLKIYEAFPGGEAKLSGFMGAVSLPVQYALSALVFRPRVLDAWVRRQLPTARESFSKRDTVRERSIHVPVGVFLDRRLKPELTPKDLHETFERNQSRLLISGVGGAGKTSLACQVANWAMAEKPEGRLRPKYPMLPVLLEHDFTSRGPDALKEEVRAQLGDSVNAGARVPDALLRALLEKRHVLVVIDGLSEMNDATREAILSGMTLIPVNAVVFTSRGDEALADLSKTVIRPTRIKGNRLSSFVETYLTSLGKKEMFEDREFFAGCQLLSAMVNDRDVTALLAKLFVDLMVAKQEKTFDEDLPNSIPDLMCKSIEDLHKKTPSNSPALRDVLKSAKAVAWECLRKDYRPLPAGYEEVKRALARLPCGERSLEHLKDRLNLIETAAYGEKVRFKIDPLAEYLAAMYLVEENRYNRDKWRNFFDTASEKAGATENITGFLLAVRDCCLTEEVRNDVPGFVVDELTGMTKVGR